VPVAGSTLLPSALRKRTSVSGTAREIATSNPVNHTNRPVNRKYPFSDPAQWHQHKCPRKGRPSHAFWDPRAVMCLTPWLSLPSLHLSKPSFALETAHTTHFRVAYRIPVKEHCCGIPEACLLFGSGRLPSGGGANREALLRNLSSSSRSSPVKAFSKSAACAAVAGNPSKINPCECDKTSENAAVTCE
jgi:hypothetical protein